MEEMVQVSAARLRKLEEMEAKARLSARRATIKNLIYIEKAKEIGIEVTKAEVDERMATEDARRAAEASQR